MIPKIRYLRLILIFSFCTFTSFNLYAINPPNIGDFPDEFWESMYNQEIGLRYGDPGWIKKINQFKKQTKRLLPDNLNYQKITTISQEAREKLTANRPRSLGHAAALPGVSKADLTALLIWLKLHSDEKTTAT